MTWVEELALTADIAPHFVLTGNTWDFVVSREAGPVRALPVLSHLREIAAGRGVQFLVVADPVQGFSLAPLVEDTDGLVASLPSGLSALELHDPAAVVRTRITPTAGQLADMLANVASSPQLGGLVVVDGGRWIVDLRNLEDDEHLLFTLASSAARRSVLRDGGATGPTHSPVYWICRNEFELPPWYISDPCVRTVNVPPPERVDRRRLGAELVAEDDADTFADATDGLSARDLLAVGRLADADHSINDAATLVRLGVTDDPWAAPDLLERLQDGRASLAQSVRGQNPALDAAWSAITRSLMGLSGAHRPSSGRRPKIVLFLAGPTGTGKTELAKSIAQLLFGDRDAIVRFDMSGYSAEHSNQRLVGAPPGYVGHEAGGELTNAARERPFSVVLFDEIEKAHPRILELFLQLLDEGHLDDGLGRRVHFDQSVIIFTSNLGVGELIEAPGAAPRVIALVDDTMEYGEIRERVTSGIRSHFKDRLGRPEILNRFGDNLVVFDFLRPEAAAEVFGILVANVAAGVRDEHGITLTFEPSALDDIRAACCADLSMGGRGIANKVESLFINPLSVWLFDHIGNLPEALRVTAWHEHGPTVEVECG